MQKVAFYSKWLDNPNGSVKDCPKNEMEQNETGTQNPAKLSNSTAGLLARVVKGVVSFLQNLLSPLTRKEGVRGGQVSRLRALSQTTAVGTLYGLLFAGLLLMPFQMHRVTAAPPAEETVETQEVTLVGVLIGIGISLTAMALWKGGEWVFEEMKTPNGTLVAETDIAVESLDGATSFWYVGRGFTGERNSFSEWKYDEDDASAEKLKSHYEYWDIWVDYVQWDEGKEYYVTTDSQSFWGDLFYLPGCINSAYNYGNFGDEDTGNTG